MAATEEKIIGQLQAQCMALETVLKATIAMLLMWRLKDPLDAAKFAELSRNMKDRLIAGARQVTQRPEFARFPDLAAEFEATLTGTIARCFDESTQMLDLIAKVGLEVTEPASDAKN